MTKGTYHPKRAVMYLRVASAHQQDATAISRQREACRRIAEKHGLTVVREYADHGRPARLEQQTELRRLLDDLDQLRDAAFVIVWDYARLGRSMGQLDEVIRRIHACGAELATITGAEEAKQPIHLDQISKAMISDTSTTTDRTRISTLRKTDLAKIESATSFPREQESHDV